MFPSPKPILLPLCFALALGVGCGDDRMGPVDSSSPSPTSAMLHDAPTGDENPAPRRLPAQHWGQLAPEDPPPSPSTPNGAVPGQAVVRLIPGADLHQFHATWGTATLDALDGGDAVLVSVPAGVDVHAISTAMSGDEDCTWAEPNYLSEIPEGRQGTIPFYEGDHVFTDVADQDALIRIGAPEAHLTAIGAGVIVAVLDTGIDDTHPDLASSVTTMGWDFVDDDPLARDERNAMDDDSDGLVDEGAGHGTHVAGLVLAAAPGATLMPVRVLDSEGAGTAVGVALGIRWAIDHGADIINLSLGMYAESHVIRDAIDAAEDAGVIVVSSAGNRGVHDDFHFPSVLSDVVAVAATDPFDGRASFSNFGSHVDVAAPGVGLLSTFLDHGYAIWSGTSMAAPIVSGCIALALEQTVTVSPHALRERFESTSAPIANALGTSWYGKMGEGRVDLAAFVQDDPHHE